MFQQQAKPQFAFEGGHLVMYHKEPTGLPKVKDATVNDRDRMQDLLAQEKYLTWAYTTAMNEASHEELWRVMKQNFDACQQLQRQIFNGMFKKGWYKLPVADAQALSHTLQQFKQYQTQFPFPTRLQQGAQQHGTHQQGTQQQGAQQGFQQYGFQQQGFQQQYTTQQRMPQTGAYSNTAHTTQEWVPSGYGRPH